MDVLPWFFFINVNKWLACKFIIQIFVWISRMFPTNQKCNHNFKKKLCNDLKTFFFSFPLFLCNIFLILRDWLKEKVIISLNKASNPMETISPNIVLKRSFSIIRVGPYFCPYVRYFKLLGIISLVVN